jgi:hypothetical protein
MVQEEQITLMVIMNLRLECKKFINLGRMGEMRMDSELGIWGSYSRYNQ